MKTATANLFHTRSLFRAMDKATEASLLQGAAVISESRAGYMVQPVSASAAKAIARMQGEAVTGFGRVISVAFANHS